MNYTLLPQDTTKTIQEQILFNRGIQDAESYLNANVKDIYHWSFLDNMQLAVETVQNCIVNGQDILTAVDPDFDGQASSAMFYNYFREMKGMLYVLFQDDKNHGLSDSLMEQIIKTIKNNKNISVLAILDAQADDKKCKIIEDLGVKVVVLDHHVTETPNKHAILVNPQQGNYPNPFLSGSCVVWKFLKCYSEMNGDNKADRYVDMAAVSLLSDSMDISHVENRAILNLGLSNINNKMLLAFIKGVEMPDKEETQFSRKVETPTDWSFNVIPLVNGLIRVGSQEDKRLLFDAFAEIETIDYDYTNPKTKEQKKETVYERTFRICKNAKAKQDREVLRAMDVVRKDIEDNKRNRHKILFCKADNELVDKNYSGLIAIKLANEFNKPVVLLREGKGGYLSGSIRNFDGSPLEKLKTFLESFGYVNWIQGHENSAGIAMTTNQIQKLIPLVNKKLENYSFEKKYTLDFEYDVNDLDTGMLEEIYSMRYYYAQGLRKSLMMVKNINFNSGEIEFLGKSVKNTWKIKIKNNLDLIKFKINNNDDLYDKFSEDSLFNWNNQKMNMNAIVEIGVNEWNGNKKWQLIVLEYEIVNQENNKNESDDGW